MTDNDRRYQRVTERIEVDLGAVYESPTLYSLTQIRNLSLGGAFVRSDVLDEVGTEHILQFSVPSAAHPIAVVGRVVWTKLDPPWHAGMGLQFISMETHDQKAINDFVDLVRRAKPLEPPHEITPALRN
jgi:Tfp pilus assembly protein PilZ